MQVLAPILWTGFVGVAAWAFDSATNDVHQLTDDTAKLAAIGVAAFGAYALIKEFS